MRRPEIHTVGELLELLIDLPLDTPLVHPRGWDFEQPTYEAPPRVMIESFVGEPHTHNAVCIDDPKDRRIRTAYKAVVFE